MINNLSPAELEHKEHYLMLKAVTIKEQIKLIDKAVRKIEQQLIREHNSWVTSQRPPVTWCFDNTSLSLI
jgi:hypothetical protein